MIRRKRAGARTRRANCATLSTDMLPSRLRFLVPLAAFALAIGAPSLARATDFTMDGSGGGQLSTWRGDVSAFGSLKLGLRFADLAGPYLLGRVGYGTVDERMLTTIQLGAQLWLKFGKVRPYVRLGIEHSHEETLAEVRIEPGGALFGIGDGIRHRAGGELGLGFDVPFHEAKSVQWFVGGDALASLYPDGTKGPVLYGGVAARLGFNYKL